MNLIDIRNKSIDKVIAISSGMIVVFPITKDNKSRVLLNDNVFTFDASFSDALNINVDEEFLTILKKSSFNTYLLASERVIGWGASDPYFAFHGDISLNEEKIIARVTGKYGNFFLRNCSVMEGECIIISKSEHEDFDRFFKVYNKRNKLSLRIDYLPYNVPSLALSKTKMIDKDGVIDTPDGYMFVLKTFEKRCKIEISAEGDSLFIPRFNSVC